MYQRRTLTLTDEERTALLYHRDHDPKPYVRERCAALLKIAQGHSPLPSPTPVCFALETPDTVYACLDLYQQEGLPGLFTHQHGGNRRGCL